MIDLILGPRQVYTFFDLLGDKEIDMTHSLGWVIAKSEIFRSAWIKELFSHDVVGEPDSILLQSHSEKAGFTDIEIVAPSIHLIIEAKRGRQLPTEQQLAKYAWRMKRERKLRAIIAIGEYTEEAAEQFLHHEINGILIKYSSWQKIAKIAQACQEDASLQERRLLDDFTKYLRRILKMQEFESNRVYVLSLGKWGADFSSVSWIDFVVQKRIYFHPHGRNGWPDVSPTYLGFRYNGKLQHIHHVDDAKVVPDLSAVVPEIDAVKWHKKKHGPHLLYKLGPPIIPVSEVKSGSIYRAAHHWAALDLLLTSSTIKEAVDLTRERSKKE